MRSLITMAAAGAASLSMAQAASLDFRELDAGFVGSKDAVLSNAQLKGGGDADDLLIFHRTGDSSGFCFVKVTFCNAGGEIFFNEAVHDLSFRVSNWRSGDRARVTAFDDVGTELIELDLTANETVDLTSLTNVHRLVFVDISTSIQPGVVYNDFVFETGPVTITPVPVPAGAALMATGALALFRRRQTS
ncbi:MAG: hypothetical protein HRU11_02365 [Parvularculaceae bacterium]|nr:hypothetical protein [Parvularculaceae bacterium]